VAKGPLIYDDAWASGCKALFVRIQPQGSA